MRAFNSAELPETVRKVMFSAFVRRPGVQRFFERLVEDLCRFYGLARRTPDCVVHIHASALQLLHAPFLQLRHFGECLDAGERSHGDRTKRFILNRLHYLRRHGSGNVDGTAVQLTEDVARRLAEPPRGESYLFGGCPASWVHRVNVRVRCGPDVRCRCQRTLALRLRGPVHVVEWR